MTREILFKARRLDGTGWTRGDFVENRTNGNCYIYSNTCGHASPIRVIPDTVMQYTGSDDDHQVLSEKIFDGDILMGEHYETGPSGEERILSRGVVQWGDEKGQWVVQEIRSGECYDLYDWCTRVFLVGASYDNPELLNPEYEG